MTHRLASTLMWSVLLLLLALAVAGCFHAGSSTAGASPRPTGADATSGAASSSLSRDPALRAALRFEQAHCSWDWRRPQARYVAAQQTLATPAFGRELAAAADPTSWRAEVVASRQQVTCTVTSAQRLVGAPATSTSVYVRMSVTEHVGSTIGSFDVGSALASWHVEHVAGRWLVAGSFDGG